MIWKFRNFLVGFRFEYVDTLSSFHLWAVVCKCKFLPSKMNKKKNHQKSYSIWLLRNFDLWRHISSVYSLFYCVPSIPRKFTHCSSLFLACLVSFLNINESLFTVCSSYFDTFLGFYETTACQRVNSLMPFHPFHPIHNKASQVCSWISQENGAIYVVCDIEFSKTGFVFDAEKVFHCTNLH